MNATHYKWLWWFFWGMAIEASQSGNHKLEAVWRENMTDAFEKQQKALGLRSVK